MLPIKHYDFSRGWLALAYAQQRMMLGAAETIVRRSILLASGAMTAAEAAAMVTEKPAAFALAWEKAAVAAAKGAAPNAVARAALAPIGSKTRANARRLRAAEPLSRRR